MVGNINSIIDIGYVDNGEGLSRPETKTIHKERRRDLLHKVTHFIAGIIIITFLFLLSYGLITKSFDNVPDYFVAIVSTIIGFYFGRYLEK